MVADNGPDALSGDGMAVDSSSLFDRDTGAKSRDDAAVDAVLRSLERIKLREPGALTVDERTKRDRNRARYKQLVNKHRTLPAVLDASEALANDVLKSEPLESLRIAMLDAERAYSLARTAYDNATSVAKGELERVRHERWLLDRERDAFLSSCEMLCQSSSLWPRISDLRATIHRLKIDEETGGFADRVLEGQIERHESMISSLTKVHPNPAAMPQNAKEMLKTLQTKLAELRAKLEAHREDLRPFQDTLRKLEQAAIEE